MTRGKKNIMMSRVRSALSTIQFFLIMANIFLRSKSLSTSPLVAI